MIEMTNIIYLPTVEIKIRKEENGRDEIMGPCIDIFEPIIAKKNLSKKLSF